MALNGCWKKLWPEAFCDFRGFSEKQEKIKDLLVLASDVLEERFQIVEEGDIQEAFDSHDAELTAEDLERLTAVSEPENEETEAVVERFQLTASASKRGPLDGR
jgi:hypothetical protein